jgi:hypothetical protein
MKSVLCCLIVLISTSFFQVKGQRMVSGEDSIIYNKLLRMDFKKYVDKPVAVFFRNLGCKYRKAIPLMQKPGFIHRALFSFSDSLYLEIRVKKLGQKKKLNFDYKFNPEVFLSKDIEWICLKYAGACIKGCEQLDCD